MSWKIRLAWISTYNSRCGLATHSEHLLEHFDHDIYEIVVIANHQEPVKPDPAYVVRLWPDDSGTLAAVRDFIHTFDAVFVNFHFSLIGIDDLAETLRAAQQADIDTYVDLHKTLATVIDGRAVSLSEIAPALRGSTRLIVHTEADVARLATFGVVDNVVMIPLGVIDRPALSQASVRDLLNLQQFHPIVGTFGFLLPSKGLPQLIDAFALVRRHFPDAMLLMLNAEYPAAESAEERWRCLALIRELALEEHVRLIDTFLETDEILLLLNACDLTVFPYQGSDESDSGAVRLGLAARRPVATTPLPIFANLAGIAHQLAGGTVGDIAAGIVALLRDPDRCAELLHRQQDWIGRNSWAMQAARIDNLIRGGFARRHGVAPVPPAAARRQPVSLGTSVGPREQLVALGERAAAKLTQRPPPPSGRRPVARPPVPKPEIGRGAVEWLPVMNVGPVGKRTPAGVSGMAGHAGHLVYGPYARLGAGDYRVRLRWSALPARSVPSGQPVATIEAVSGHGQIYLAQRELAIEEGDRPEHDLQFCVGATPPQPPLAIEVRVWTSGLVPLTVASITIERIGLTPPTAFCQQPECLTSE